MEPSGGEADRGAGCLVCVGVDGIVERRTRNSARMTGVFLNWTLLYDTRIVHLAFGLLLDVSRGETKDACNHAEVLTKASGGTLSTGWK